MSEDEGGKPDESWCPVLEGVAEVDQCPLFNDELDANDCPAVRINGGKCPAATEEGDVEEILKKRGDDEEGIDITIARSQVRRYRSDKAGERAEQALDPAKA